MKKLGFDLQKILLIKDYQRLTLLFIIFSLYIKTFNYDYNLDDYILTDSLDGKVNNLKDLAALFKLSYNNTDYRPIVFLSIGIERLIFGTFNPAVSHIVNIILYFFVCISGLKLFSLLFGEEKSLILFFAVLLFCVHPLNTEVVCSIKCRDNLLSMLFGLNSSIFLIKYSIEKKQHHYLLIAIILSLIAILSKLDALGFLLFNIGYVIFFKNNRKLTYILVYTIVSIFILIVQSTIWEKIFANDSTTYKGIVSFTENPLALNFSMPNRIMAALNTIYYYFTKLTYISPSRYYYGYNYYDILSSKTTSFFGGTLILVFLLSAFIYGIIRKKKILSISIIGIITSGAYAFNFYQPVAGIIADRYVFMTNLFFCLLLSYIIQVFAVASKVKQSVFYITIAIILLFSILTFKRIGAWKDLKTLIDTDAPALYRSYEAMRIAANGYFKEYEKAQQTAYLDKAIFYAEKGNKVYPRNILLHLQLGQFYFKKGNYNDAIKSFKMAAKNDSTLSEPLVYLGDTYYAIKNLDFALFYYQKALNKMPKNPILINNISTVYYEKGAKEKCLQFNNDLLSNDSTIYAAYENLGYYYLAEKDTIKAKKYFSKGEKFGLKPVNINSSN